MKEYLGWSALEEIASWVKKYFARKTHTHSVGDIEKFGDEVGQIIALLVVVDTALNIASNNAVSNATVTRELEDIKQKIIAGGGGNLDYDIIATEVLKKLKILTAESEIDPSADLTDTIVGGELFRTISVNIKNDVSSLLEKFDEQGKLKEEFYDFESNFDEHIKKFYKDFLTDLAYEPYDEIIKNGTYTIKYERMPNQITSLFDHEGKIGVNSISSELNTKIEGMIRDVVEVLVIVDTALNIDSNNAISNKAVTKELEDIKQKILAGGGNNLDYDAIAAEVLKKLRILTDESQITPGSDLTNSIVGGELFRAVSANLKNDISTLLSKFDNTGKLKEAYFDFNGQFQTHIKDFHRNLMTGLVNESYDDIVQNSQYTIKNEHMPYPFADLFDANGKIKSEFLPASSGGGGDDIDMVKVVDKIYPVGSIWIGMSYDDPRDLFGHHTKWKRLENRFLLGFDGGSKRVGYRGGEAEHTLTVDEMPSHTHNLNRPWSNGKGKKKAYTQSDNRKQYFSVETQSTGGGQPHNNMPPYLVVSMWMRDE